MAKTTKNPLQQSSWSITPKSVVMGVLSFVVLGFMALTGLGIARPISSTVLGVVGRVTGMNTGGDGGVEVL